MKRYSNTELVIFVILFLILLVFLVFGVKKLLECQKQLSTSKENLTIPEIRRTIQFAGQTIQDVFRPFYDVVDFENYTLLPDVICIRFGVGCITVHDNLEFLQAYFGTYALNILYNVLLDAYTEEARDQYLYSVESFTQAENQRISTIMSKARRYISQQQFDSIFQFMYPVENNQPNIYLWEFQMYVYLEMLDLLNIISQSGGNFVVNRLQTSVQVVPEFFPVFRLSSVNQRPYTYSGYTINIDNFTLSNLIWYIPTGTWTYEFMLLMSLYNIAMTGPWLPSGVNIVHPEAVNPSFFNNRNLQRNLTPGIFMPIISPGSWESFIFGSIRGGNTESKYKLEWDSSFTANYNINKTIVNAYGERVNVPDSSFAANQNPTSSNRYKDYLFNTLVYNMLLYENPIMLPYGNNQVVNYVVKFTDQTLALRKQDFNRRLNLSRKDYFTLQGCNDAILINGVVSGYTGYLSYMRENVLDTINDFSTLTLSGWFFSVVRPYIVNVLPRFPPLVVNGVISTDNLVTIKQLEGACKPVSNSRTVTIFGACRPVSSCKKCRKPGGCTAESCDNLRSHAANDFYGSHGNPVKSSYFGTVLSIETRFFPDVCSDPIKDVSDACPFGYSCKNSQCKSNLNGSVFTLPAVVIKHIDGTVSRYGEFPVSVRSGQELKTGDQIGSIVSYTNQCHFEMYSGAVNILPWLEGGFGRNSANATTIKDGWVRRFSLPDKVTPANAINPALFDYYYVPEGPCIENCNFVCHYQRRRDLINADLSMNWSN